MANFLVVGLGFVATHIAEYLAKFGSVTVTYRSLGRVKEIYARLLRDSVELVRLDPIEDKDMLLTLVRRSDTVINLVGTLGPRPEDLKVAHVEVPRVIASAVESAGGGVMLIHVSASNAMGPIGSFIREEGQHCSGASPSNAYEESKCMGERVVYESALRGNYPLAIVRPTLIYGKYAAHSQFIQMYRVVKRGILPNIGLEVSAIAAGTLAELTYRLHQIRPKPTYMYATECSPIRLGAIMEYMAVGLGIRAIRVNVPNILAKAALRLMSPREVRGLLRYIGVRYSCDKVSEVLGRKPYFNPYEVVENARFLKMLEGLSIV